MSFLKPWNFEKILSDSYSLKNFWFFGSFGFPKFQYLSGMFSFRFGTYSFRSGMNSYLSGIHSFRCNFSHSARYIHYPLSPPSCSRGCVQSPTEARTFGYKHKYTITPHSSPSLQQPNRKGAGVVWPDQAWPPLDILSHPDWEETPVRELDTGHVTIDTSPTNIIMMMMWISIRNTGSIPSVQSVYLPTTRIHGREHKPSLMSSLSWSILRHRYFLW